MQQTYKQRPIRKKSRFRRFVNNSITVSVLTYLSVRLHSLLNKGVLAGFFASSDYTDKAKNNGLLSAAIDKIRPGWLFSAIRRAFAGSVESSAVVRFYRAVIKALFAASVKSFGVFFISAGLYSLLAYTIRIYMVGGVARTQADAVVITLMVLVSAFLFFSKKSLGNKIGESAIFTFFLNLFGINRLAIDSDASPVNHFPAAFFAGLAYGVAGFFFSPVRVLFYIMSAAVLLLILYSPESGLLITLTAIPFGNEGKLYLILFATLISYILKLLRGKRNLTFKSEDLPAVFFAFIFIIAFPHADVRKLIMLVSSYFIASNLMRNTSFLKKSAYCLTLGLMVRTFVQTAMLIFGFFDIDFLRITGLPGGGYLSYDGFMVIAAVPFAVFLFDKKSNDDGFRLIFRILFVVSSLFNLCVSMSDAVWISALVCLFIYLVYRTVRFFNVLFVYVITVPVIYYIRGIVSVFNYIESFKPSAVLTGSPDVMTLLFGGGFYGGDGPYGKLIESFGVLGCVLGMLFLLMLLARSFTSSSLSRDDGMRGLCAVFIATLAVILFYGLTSDTLGTGNQILMFWVICGLISATGNAVPMFIHGGDIHVYAPEG